MLMRHFQDFHSNQNVTHSYNPHFINLIIKHFIKQHKQS